MSGIESKYEDQTEVKDPKKFYCLEGTWIAYKGHHRRHNQDIIVTEKTFLKKRYLHSKKLPPEEKIQVYPGQKFDYQGHYRDYFIVSLKPGFQRKIETIKNNLPVKRNNQPRIRDIKKKINLILSDDDIFVKQISATIIRNMVNKKYQLTINKQNIENNLITIGSYLHLAPNNCYIYGTNARKSQESKTYSFGDDLKIISYQGPLTAKFLESRKVQTSEVYGSLALLIMFFYEPRENKSISSKYTLLPRKEHFGHYQKTLDKNKYFLINPNLSWDKIIDLICQSKGLVSEQLYPLICADSYGVPNLWLDTTNTEENSFIFEDYFLSQGRQIEKIIDILQFSPEIMYREGNKIDLDKLLFSFPFR